MSKAKNAQTAQLRRWKTIRNGMAALALLLAAAAVFRIWSAMKKADPATDMPLAAATMTVTPAPEQTVEPQPAPIPTPEITHAPTPEPTPELRSCTIRCVGDLVIHAEVMQGTPQENGVYDFSSLFELIADSMGAADYTVANIDGAIKGVGPYTGYPNFNTPAELIGNLQDAGVDMLTLANNHALDFYFDGLKATMECCDKYGMAFVGAARSQKEHDTPVIVDINGIQVGMLNYTQYLNGMDTLSDPAATIYGICTTNNSNYAQDVRKLRENGADVVVAFLHWGKEYEHTPDNSQTLIARQLTAAGVDVIIGGHPHYLQEAGYIYADDAQGNRRKALCMFSLGNFLADSKYVSYDTGVIFEFGIQETPEGDFEIVSPKYVPTYIWREIRNDGSYWFRIVPAAQYMNERPKGMSEYTWGLMKQGVQLAQNIMGKDVAQLIER